MHGLYIARSVASQLTMQQCRAVHASVEIGSRLPRFKALFVDAAGTLLYPAQPVTQIYQRFAKRHGVAVSESQILSGYREAFANPPVPDFWSSLNLRYVGDGKVFWRHVISKATGSDSEALLEDLYHYYERREAWVVPQDAKPALLRLKRHGIKCIVVSNFDTRLRPLLATLGFRDVFDAVIVSAEVEMEKPNPCIFEKALEVAKCDPEEVIHVGDDRRNDVWGAREAGIDAWLWGLDVMSFEDIAQRILSPSTMM